MFQIEPDYHLPQKYGETFIVLMIRDPENIFAYWEVTEKSINEPPLAIRLSWTNLKKIITIFDCAESWYISVKDQGFPLFGELGRILADGTFITLAVSNRLDNYLVSPHNGLNNNLYGILAKWQPGVSS